MTPPPEPVAWDVAERVAGGWPAQRARDRLGDPPRPRDRLRGGHRRGGGPRRALHGPALAGRAGPGPGRDPGGVDPRQHLLVPPLARARARTRRQGLAGAFRACSARRQGRGRGRDGRRARMDVRAGARPVRPACSPRAIRPQDAVYYVGPNIVSLERRHGFDPREFRLWIALHELTHRAQFTGVPWMRDHFLELVESSVAIASPGPAPGDGRSRPHGSRHPLGPEPARRVRARRGARLARAARDAALDPGDDEPARGPRRRHDGPRRRST